MMKVNLSVITMILLCIVLNQASKYTGVSWNKTTKTWRAELRHNKKSYYVGLFENEEHAAMGVNLLCDKLNLKRKNPTIDIEPDKIQQVQNKTSKCIGVSWDNNAKKWKAQLTHNKKKYHCELFDNEEHAAMSVNLICDKLELKRKNSTIDIEPDKIQQAQNQTSKYTGVSWNTRNKNWKAQLAHNTKIYYGGYFDKEEDAALSVNFLCDEFGIQRKNPKIGMEFDAIRQKIKSKMYASKAENTVNENVKVEDENILDRFKDECENNFMKRPCQSKKQKRQKHSIILNDVIEEQIVNTTPDDGNKFFEKIQKDYTKILD